MKKTLIIISLVLVSSFVNVFGRDISGVRKSMHLEILKIKDGMSFPEIIDMLKAGYILKSYKVGAGSCLIYRDVPRGMDSYFNGERQYIICSDGQQKVTVDVEIE